MCIGAAHPEIPRNQYQRGMTPDVLHLLSSLPQTPLCIPHPPEPAPSSPTPLSCPLSPSSPQTPCQSLHPGPPVPGQSQHPDSIPKSAPQTPICTPSPQQCFGSMKHCKPLSKPPAARCTVRQLPRIHFSLHRCKHC